jgi:hypothetical protein
MNTETKVSVAPMIMSVRPAWKIRALIALALLLLSVAVAAETVTLSLSQWKIEAEQGGRITVREGVLDVDVPAGATLWFKRELHAPVAMLSIVAIPWNGSRHRGRHSHQ